MTSRPGRLRLLLILICLSFPLASGSLASQSGGARPAGNPAQVWTGTVTVETRGSGPMMPSGEGSKIRFVGSESVTYSLRGDGTAGWTATASNTTDMAGLATIPMRGSGSGHGRGSVTFNGQSWDIAVESEDEYPTSTDLTAWDKVFAEGVFGWAIAMAQAMGHQLPSGDHVEEGRMDPSGADVSAAGAATASTLSGSQRYETESTHIGGFNGVSATVTVTWNLRRGPVAPSVRIYGPECGCMTNDDTEKSLHFIAGATPEGGEFSEFVVTSNGKMPEIISNNGGDQPSLDLVGTKDTGEVTLKITYTQNGVRRTSDPFVVNFCAIEKLELADDEHDLAFDGLGRLVVNAKAKAWRAGNDVSAELEWDLEKMGAPTELRAEPANRTGKEMRFTYWDLPKQNTDFGAKRLTARTKNVCACERGDTIRAFFVATDNDHPDDRSPNWFYYWKQTPAAGGARARLEYRASVEDASLPGVSAAVYDPVTTKIYFSDELIGAKGCHARYSRETGLMLLDPSTNQARGIDCFGETARHEMQHRTDAIAWWGTEHGKEALNTAEYVLLDPDGDMVPSRIESQMTGCSSFNKFSCPQRPFPNVIDAEINAYWVGWEWVLKSADAHDWSCGPLAKQWKGKKCGH